MNDIKQESEFAIKVEDDKWSPPPSKMVSITHNGYQWQGISLTPDEARQLIRELEKFASEEKQL